MTGLRFRNIDFDADAPVEAWPSEAIATAIERGSLTDWRRIAAAVRVDPWGPVARGVDALVRDGSGPYGVSAGLERLVAQAREAWDRADRDAVAHELGSLQRGSGLTAGEFARRLATSPSRMSTYLSGSVVPSAALMVRARRVGTRGDRPG